ncbi:hypothetical protein [Arthrobacter rhombi]|uniref:hypothetical protein n=1 Tax=Arthrobacter rhombi TaxID=71253 RepID=UPI003FD1EBD8
MSSITLGGTTSQIDIAVEILGIFDDAKDWIIVAEVLSHDRAHSSDELSWFYSDVVEKNFVYIPADYYGGLLRLKTLKSSSDFDRVRLSIVRLPWAKNGMSGKIQPRIMRCRYGAHKVRKSIQNSTSSFVHSLGEVRS